MGTSMAAAWAWGSSLMVGSAIAVERGLLPFLIWAAGNSLMLPFFGFMVQKFPNLEKATSTKVFVFFMTIMQFFITWVNMQAVYMVSTQIGIPSTWAKILAIAVALVFILSVYRKGLELAIIVDYWEWLIMLVAIAFIVTVGMSLGEATPIPMLNEGGHIRWALFGAASLMCGGFIDLQQWQRAKVAIAEKRTGAFWVAGIMFATYMVLIGLMASVQFTFWLSLVLLIVALLVTTDTLISVGAAMQEVGGNKMGAVFGIIAVVGWHFVYEYGIINLWNGYATFRLVIVTIMIATVIIWTYAEKKRGKAPR
jgi:hypothetical protein